MHILFCGFIHYYVISIKDLIFDFYISTLKQELSGTEAYEHTSAEEKSVTNHHIFSSPEPKAPGELIGW